eukprot:SAG31_NODE_19554_length_599_cov_0.584000_1_plen_118_part_00
MISPVAFGVIVAASLGRSPVSLIMCAAGVSDQMMVVCCSKSSKKETKSWVVLRIMTSRPSQSHSMHGLLSQHVITCDGVQESQHLLFSSGYLFEFAADPTVLQNIPVGRSVTVTPPI